jgi:GTP cyclohydrolase II
MPTHEPANGGGAAIAWREGSVALPSFYSPATKPHTTILDDAAIPDHDLSNVDAIEEHSTAPDRGPASLRDLPPPSLVSPAFTPPTTPGTATPPYADHKDPDTREPRGVPVDSTISDGGCGNSKPRLLEELPKVECIVRARIPTTAGTEMFLHLYSNNVDNKEHLAIVFGGHIRSKSLDAVREGETEMDRMIRGAYTGRLYPGRIASGMTAGASLSTESQNTETQSHRGIPLVRIHSECYTGETAWSARCDCGEQLDEAARLMSLPGNQAGGIIIYLRQEGRGIGLGEKLKAYNLQDLGSDTVEANLLLRHPADARSYGLATAMLMDLDQTEIRLLTNNPDKIRAVEGPNREIVVRERVAMVPLSWKGLGGFRSREVEGYLKTKVSVSGILLPHPQLTLNPADRENGPSLGYGQHGRLSAACKKHHNITYLGRVRRYLHRWLRLAQAVC